MNQFEIDQLRRQRRSYLKSIVGLEAVHQLSPGQAGTLARYKEQIVRIERILVQNGASLDP